MYGGTLIHYLASTGLRKICMQTKPILLDERRRYWLPTILALMPTGKSLIRFKPRNPFEVSPFIYKSCILSLFINFVIARLNINTNRASAGTSISPLKFHPLEEWESSTELTKASRPEARNKIPGCPSRDFVASTAQGANDYAIG